VSSIGVFNYGLVKIVVESNDEDNEYLDILDKIDLYPSVPSIVQNNCHVSGKLKLKHVELSDDELTKKIKIVTQYGYIGTDPDTFNTTILDLSNVSENITIHKMIARSWAQNKINDILLINNDEESQNQQLLKLGRKYNLVTPNSSLIVLENLDQYLMHEIEPSEALTDMKKKYLEIISKRKKEKTDKEYEKINQINNWWDRRKSWYSSQFFLENYNKNLYYISCNIMI